MLLFIGKMFMGILMIGFILIIGVIVFFVSGFSKSKKGSGDSQSHSGYSTSRSSQSYYSTSSPHASRTSSKGADEGKDKYSTSYKGPTAKRKQKDGKHGAKPQTPGSGSSPDVTEIPLINVTDVKDDSDHS